MAARVQMCRSRGEVPRIFKKVGFLCGTSIMAILQELSKKDLPLVEEKEYTRS